MLHEQQDGNQFFYGQREKLFNNDDQQIIQIEQQLNRLQQLFDWMDQDTYTSLKTKIIQGIKNSKENVKIKYITAACCFNEINSKSGISQADCLKALMSTFKVKSRKLLEYLRLIKEDNRNEFDKLIKQVPNYQERLRKYFYGQGQSILLKLKSPQKTYTMIIDELINENKKMMTQLYSMDVVKQFCESKRPSRLVINMGFLVLQIQGIFILPGEYAKLFRISINSLRYFTKGLMNTLYEFAGKLLFNTESIKIATQSQTYVEELEDKKEESSNFDILSEIDSRKIGMIKQFMSEFDTYLFLLVDTSEEDQLFFEFEEIMNQ